MQGEAQKRFAMNGNLRRALERDHFVLHYQPQIDLTTGEIVGVEALIRWAYPDFGMINPLELVPVAVNGAEIGAGRCARHRRASPGHGLSGKIAVLRRRSGLPKR